MSDGGVKSRSRGQSARWAAHRARRRAQLVEAAIEAVRTHGAGVSVATIAATAGVTKPVLYRHFTDRADLRRAVSERGARMLTERLVPKLSSEREPLRRVSAISTIIEAFLAAAEEEPELWRFVVHNPGNREAGEDVVAHSIALIAGLLTSVLVDELRERGRDAGGAEAFAYGLVGMVYTAGDWWLRRRTMTRAALTDYLTSLVWGGLAGVAGAGEPAQEPAAAPPTVVPLRGGVAR